MGAARTIGCATAIRGRPLMLRECMLQVRAQTVRPQFHAIHASGSPALDRRFIADLLDETVILDEASENLPVTQAYTAALRLLRDKDVDLFFCIDSDDVYRRTYIEEVLRLLDASPIDHVRDYANCNPQQVAPTGAAPRQESAGIVPLAQAAIQEPRSARGVYHASSTWPRGPRAPLRVSKGEAFGRLLGEFPRLHVTPADD